MKPKAKFKPTKFDIEMLNDALARCGDVIDIVKHLEKSGKLSKDFPLWLFSRGRFELEYLKDLWETELENEAD